MVSKRLAFSVMLGIGVASLYYLTFVNPISVFRGDGDAVRTYSYSSLPLRFTKGNVKIKAKSGYVAYEGNVEKGQVTGAGTLYSPDREVVYMGAFQSNKYNGLGKEYYPGQILKYNGSFVDNLYEGEGSLYRKNGTKEYEGTFSLGMKEGKGILFDSSSKEIYTGNFSKDQLLYSDLLGKKTTDIAECYKGVRKVYTDDNFFVVHLQDINALYTGAVGEDSLDGSVSIDSVYVLKHGIYINGKNCSDIADLEEALGDPVYEGNSTVTMPEAVAIKALNDSGDTFFDPIELTLDESFEDASTVENFESEFLLYLYSYRYENLVYTFYTNEKYGAIGIYQIEKDETAVQTE
ncbi:MAG: hypothetical protein PHE02_14675 [Lachnospiraceae bacterium]|nr:hypothetical protein [Lachnospiraceae bacterium]